MRNFESKFAVTKKMQTKKEATALHLTGFEPMATPTRWAFKIYYLNPGPAHSIGGEIWPYPHGLTRSCLGLDPVDDYWHSPVAPQVLLALLHLEFSL